MPTTWETSGAIKVARAKEHIQHLDTAIAAYKKDQNPYGIVRHDDADTGDLIWYAVVTVQPPPRLGAIAGDAIHNLRSSLDILWHLLMFPGGGGGKDRFNQFRVYDSREDFDKAQRARVVKPARQAVVDIYRALKPYKGGNDLLWSLVTLDNIDKHRLLIPVVSAITRFDFNVYSDVTVESGAEEVPAFLRAIMENIRPVRRYPLDRVTEVFRLPAATRQQVDVEPVITLEVAFGDLGTMQAGEPVLGILNDYARLVDGIVDAYVSAGILR